MLCLKASGDIMAFCVDSHCQSRARMHLQEMADGFNEITAFIQHGACHLSSIECRVCGIGSEEDMNNLLGLILQVYAII